MKIPKEIALQDVYTSLAIFGMLIAAVGTYYKSMASVEAKIADARLQANEQFVKKYEVKDLSTKLDQLNKDVGLIAVDVGVIKGYILKNRR